MVNGIKRKPEVRIGTSGFQYSHWKGIFYTESLPPRRWLQYYADRFDTVEINNTFYHLPSEKSFDQWREQAVPGFLYALKFSRYGSHMKKLKDPEEPIERFMTLAGRLNGFLGPILVQLPPHWHAHPERLSAFLKSVPAGHRWAIEFRDPTWLREDVYGILREHNAALCFHDMLENHPREVTADWIYWRFHGTAGHAGNYSSGRLGAESKIVQGYLSRGMDVFVYFNNDVHGYAIDNALELRRLVLS
jgi:uncharacterized protein YecE (DUF72 family)